MRKQIEDDAFLKGKSNMVTLHTILKDHSEIFELIYEHSAEHGQPRAYLRVSTPEAPNPESIIFLSKNSHSELIDSHHKTLWIMTQSLWEKSQIFFLELAKKNQNSILVCRNLQMAMASILGYFDRRESLLAFPTGISPQSWIHPSAIIESEVTIGPFTTIGPHVIIQKGSRIGSHCIIEGETHIGAECFIEGHVFIGRQTQIGKRCRIKPFASIGTDGYGYFPAKNNAIKIPQIGKVIIEDFVDIGSGTCIDRATITHTRIGQGTKIDNLVHIAHNCDIGQYCFITACFAMAGSTKIGDHFRTGGATSVGSHLTIANDVSLAGASVVMSDIPLAGEYGGHPLQPMKSYLKTQVILHQLLNLKKQIHLILKHLHLNSSE